MYLRDSGLKNDLTRFLEVEFTVCYRQKHWQASGNGTFNPFSSTSSHIYYSFTSTNLCEEPFRTVCSLLLITEDAFQAILSCPTVKLLVHRTPMAETALQMIKDGLFSTIWFSKSFPITLPFGGAWSGKDEGKDIKPGQHQITEKSSRGWLESHGLPANLVKLK